MKVIRDLNQAETERESVLTVGAFDGLHLGHQELLRQLVRRAQQTDRCSGMVTFDPLPRTVLQPNENTTCLTTPKEKIRLLTRWGLDLVVIVPFTRELARTSARDFVQMLCARLQMAELWIGWDFALGSGRAGNPRTLTQLGRTMGFQVHVIEPVSDGAVVISSTQIRQLITAGRVREAAEMLGRYHEVEGTVVQGEGRGKELGFPTANIELPAHCALPAVGVYAAYVDHGDQRYPAVANIGYRPTFGESELCVEAHLMGFHGDLYGEQVRLRFVERLRAERRFASAEALRGQINRDLAEAQDILE
jgi:riboflavin kinase/FMN adenylyltransferase